MSNLEGQRNVQALQKQIEHVSGLHETARQHAAKAEAEAVLLRDRVATFQKVLEAHEIDKN